MLLTVLALAVAAVALAFQFRNLLNDRSILPPDDFVEYWAAGRLNLRGENPYDPAKLLPLNREAGREADEAIMMWNPPWTLTFVMPFGALEPRAAQLLWLLLGFVFIGLGADLLWKVYDGPPQCRWVAWLLAFTFLPTFFVLGAGQIGPWVLAGAVLFLLFMRQGWPMFAGAATVLLAIKPHLCYLFWIALVVWGVRHNRKVLLGGLIAGLIATLIPLVFNPQVIHQYWQEMTQRPPTRWLSPTLGTVIRSIEGPDKFGQTFIPGLLGLGWLAWHCWRNRAREWNWAEQMPMLLLVSFVTASYGAWPFDLIILLPATIDVAARIARKPTIANVRWGIVFWIAINVSALVLNLLKVGSFWFIWMAPVMLVAYLVLKHRSAPA
jgi:hypothetical protein